MIDNPQADKVAVKAADQTVNNSNVLVNAVDMLLHVEAYERLEGRCWLIYSAAGAADIKFGFTIPAGGDLRWENTVAITSNPMTPLTHTGIITPNGSGAGLERMIFVYFYYIGGATAGDLQLQFAQKTADVSDTILLEDSLMLARRAN